MLCVQQTTLGPIGIEENHNVIVRLLFAEEIAHLHHTLEHATPPSPLLQQAFTQLEEYLAGKRKNFSLPLAPQGTPFMLRVWHALQDVPYGKTASYKDIACAIGSPKAARAVGLANNKNPLAIFIPCHRIIGANGKLVGYGGGLEIKRTLLALEAGLP